MPSRSAASCRLLGILADGATVNKAGTYLLALAARDQGIPFYVCCESFKFAKEDPDKVELEEMSEVELETPDLPHVTIRNVYFDVTPPTLITGWITETGVQRRQDLTGTS